MLKVIYYIVIDGLDVYKSSGKGPRQNICYIINIKFRQMSQMLHVAGIIKECVIVSLAMRKHLFLLHFSSLALRKSLYDFSLLSRQLNSNANFSWISRS